MEYSQFKIETFDYWDLFLHTSQYPYLGRCYAWSTRENANMISDMNGDEREELFEYIIPKWEIAMNKIHKGFRTNLAILGNTSPHLHAHLIPRFKTPVQYKGIKFIDPNPTGNYAPYPKKEIALEILLEIRDHIRNNYSL